MTSDERFMKRALALAHLGNGQVSPNPMVGCVIVHQGEIIGEGYHQQYGGPHAEVNAVNNVLHPEKLKEATAYVTLEPCSHFGKTPPCADLLIEKQLKKVIVCNLDPNPLVAGKGMKKLADAGIATQIGVLASLGNELNAAFFTAMTQKRPYVILKWAQTQDEFVARNNYDSKWISDSLSRKWVHKWRSEVAAIMVGTTTALYDNPKLNVRSWQGNSPVRVVIDTSLRLPNHLHLFDQSIPTLCYNFSKNEVKQSLEFIQLNPQKELLTQVLQDLYQRKLYSLFVEGGAQLLQHFIQQDLWDEARVFQSPQTFGEGISAPKLLCGFSQNQRILQDQLLIYQNTSVKSFVGLT